MEAEKYLERIKLIDAILINKLEDHRIWVELADALGGFSVGERVQTTRNLHQKQNAIDRYIDIEAEIKALREERQRIIDTIQKLPPTEYDIIYKIYVKDNPNTLKEIAYQYHKSYDWAKKRKRNGLRLIQSMIDKGDI